jgi:hypothetical protein
MGRPTRELTATAVHQARLVFCHGGLVRSIVESEAVIDITADGNDKQEEKENDDSGRVERGVDEVK